MPDLKRGADDAASSDAPSKRLRHDPYGDGGVDDQALIEAAEAVEAECARKAALANDAAAHGAHGLEAQLAGLGLGSATRTGADTNHRMSDAQPDPPPRKILTAVGQREKVARDALTQADRPDRGR